MQQIWIKDPQKQYSITDFRQKRLIVENAFGLLASVFRIFWKPIEIKVESTVVDIVLTYVYLHNFLLFATRFS
jgi:hypothetical protein